MFTEKQSKFQSSGKSRHFSTTRRTAFDHNPSKRRKLAKFAETIGPPTKIQQTSRKRKQAYSTEIWSIHDFLANLANLHD
ncbi:unnamed protein product [Caenorhabditis angaria]|uniref:Uncharacterized protein n=1 Tax=Caenorhabditis angaria TaxID=860376 RepID=A0A9P1MYL4_9PELO|nr:unnamed protein product [Caenorhabditis angaria]